MPRDPGWREAASLRVEQWTAMPLLVLSLLIIPILLIPSLVELPPAVASTLLAADWAIWFVFLAEYVTRFSLAIDHWRYFRQHLLDLAFVALPMLRPLRALRAVRALRAGTAAAVVVERYRERIISRAALFALATAILVVLVSAAVVLDIEGHNPNANINDFGDAVWWAITTVTTVGYGDRYPVTGAGRAVAGGLMVVGVAVIGIVTASVAAWLVKQGQQPAQARERSEMTALQDEIRALREQVQQLVAHIAERVHHPETVGSAQPTLITGTAVEDGLPRLRPAPAEVPRQPRT
jgi:voltage-gated potassium channel